MNRPLSRLRAFGATIAIVAALSAVAVGGAPAGAAPADAAASGIRSALNISLVNGTVNATVNGAIGALNAPPAGESTLVGAAARLGTPGVATVDATVIHTKVTSTATGSSALSEVTGARVDVPGLTPLLGGVLVNTGAQIITRPPPGPIAPPTAYQLPMLGRSPD
ncbi:MAG: hypothetical protein ACR2MB_17655 [Acidimicrobiales bacterium]